MFVTTKTHNQAIKALLSLAKEYAALKREWNDLVDRINAKGGESFLSGSSQAMQLEEEDIKRLLMLCHPDKHQGKQMAHEMTQKLLCLREKQPHDQRAAA